MRQYFDGPDVFANARHASHTVQCGISRYPLIRLS
jgi:hypothetical protein